MDFYGIIFFDDLDFHFKYRTKKELHLEDIKQLKKRGKRNKKEIFESMIYGPSGIIARNRLQALANHTIVSKKLCVTKKITFNGTELWLLLYHSPLKKGARRKILYKIFSDQHALQSVFNKYTPLDDIIDTSETTPFYKKEWVNQSIQDNKKNLFNSLYNTDLPRYKRNSWDKKFKIFSNHFQN